MRSARTDGIRCTWALVVGAALGVVVTGRGVAAGASSRDYPGPCTGETGASGVPLFLAADYHGANPVYGVVILKDTGRFRLGISCVATGFVVVRVGPDSALCTVRGRCTPDELLGLTEDDIDAVRPIPGEEPFFHICEKHGFGWYDAVGGRPRHLPRDREVGKRGLGSGRRPRDDGHVRLHRQRGSVPARQLPAAARLRKRGRRAGRVLRPLQHGGR